MVSSTYSSTLDWTTPTSPTRMGREIILSWQRWPSATSHRWPPPSTTVPKSESTRASIRPSYSNIHSKMKPFRDPSPLVNYQYEYHVQYFQFKEIEEDTTTTTIKNIIEKKKKLRKKERKKENEMKENLEMDFMSVVLISSAVRVRP